MVPQTHVEPDLALVTPGGLSEACRCTISKWHSLLQIFGHKIVKTYLTHKSASLTIKILTIYKWDQNGIIFTPEEWKQIRKDAVKHLVNTSFHEYYTILLVFDSHPYKTYRTSRMNAGDARCPEQILYTSSRNVLYW